MNCEGCTNPTGGVYLTACRGCQLRSLARSPEHHEARQAGQLTPAYVRRCRQIGADVAAVHREVKALAATLGRA